MLMNKPIMGMKPGQAPQSSGSPAFGGGWPGQNMPSGMVSGPGFGMQRPRPSFYANGPQRMLPNAGQIRALQMFRDPMIAQLMQHFQRMGYRG